MLAYLSHSKLGFCFSSCHLKWDSLFAGVCLSLSAHFLVESIILSFYQRRNHADRNFRKEFNSNEPETASIGDEWTFFYHRRDEFWDLRTKFLLTHTLIRFTTFSSFLLFTSSLFIFYKLSSKRIKSDFKLELRGVVTIQEKILCSQVEVIRSYSNWCGKCNRGETTTLNGRSALE